MKIGFLRMACKSHLEKYEPPLVWAFLWQKGRFLKTELCSSRIAPSLLLTLVFGNIMA